MSISILWRYLFYRWRNHLCTITILAPCSQTAEEHLPAEFRKRLTEWEIAKALAGKSQQNVEQLQKHLPSEFNKKYEEWRLKMKMTEVKPGHGAPSQGQVRGA